MLAILTGKQEGTELLTVGLPPAHNPAVTSQIAVLASRAPVPHTLASDLSGYHQIQLGFISVRDHFEPQWLKESLELLSGGKWLKKQIAAGS